MKRRLLLIVSLLAAMFLCTNTIAYADDVEITGDDVQVNVGIDGDNTEINVDVQSDDVELNVAVNADSADVLVVVDSEDPEVNVLTGDNSEVNMGVGQDSSIYINGQDVNQPTVVHHHSDGGDGGASISQVFGAIRKRLEPVYSWMEDRDGAISLTMDGLAKVIIETKSQDSAIDVMSTDIAKNSEDITRNYEELDNRLETELTMLQAEQLTLQDGLYLRLKLLLGVIGALIIGNIVMAVKMARQ